MKSCWSYFFKRPVSNFQRANVFYKEMSLFGKPTSIPSVPLDSGWLMGSGDGRWFSSSDAVAEVGDQVEHVLPLLFLVPFPVFHGSPGPSPLLLWELPAREASVLSLACLQLRAWPP